MDDLEAFFKFIEAIKQIRFNTTTDQIFPLPLFPKAGEIGSVSQINLLVFIIFAIKDIASLTTLSLIDFVYKGVKPSVHEK